MPASSASAYSYSFPKRAASGWVRVTTLASDPYCYNVVTYKCQPAAPPSRSVGVGDSRGLPTSLDLSKAASCVNSTFLELIEVVEAVFPAHPPLSTKELSDILVVVVRALLIKTAEALDKFSCKVDMRSEICHNVIPNVLDERPLFTVQAAPLSSSSSSSSSSPSSSLSSIEIFGQRCSKLLAANSSQESVERATAQRIASCDAQAYKRGWEDLFGLTGKHQQRLQKLFADQWASTWQPLMLSTAVKMSTVRSNSNKSVRDKGILLRNLTSATTSTFSRSNSVRSNNNNNNNNNNNSNNNVNNISSRSSSISSLRSNTSSNSRRNSAKGGSELNLAQRLECCISELQTYLYRLLVCCKYSEEQAYVAVNGLGHLVPFVRDVHVPVLGEAVLHKELLSCRIVFPGVCDSTNDEVLIPARVASIS